MKITKGRIPSPKKVVVYGPEGVGKSTFAADFPDPVFIDTEGSTKELDVARFDPPSSWTMLKQQVKYVASYPEVCRTLVIDTADWAEKMEIEELCKTKGWDGLEGAGYGKGYTYSAEEFGSLLNLLGDVVDKGINVVLTAHAQLRKVELPEEMGAYDHWEMKTSKKVAPMIREWADMVLFANYKVLVKNVDGQGAQKGKNKATGGRRVMYTTHTPFWDAKNRYGLPDELPFAFDSIRHIINANAAPIQDAAPVPAVDPQPAVNNSVPEEELPPKSTKKPAKKEKAPEPVPESAPKQVEAAAETKNPPEIVNDDNLDKRIPKVLRDLMLGSGISEWSLQNVIQVRLPGAFPPDMAAKDYPQDFIDEWVIPNWDKIVEYAGKIRDEMEIPFN